MTDVRLSISVDANQGRANVRQFQAGYTALVNQLRQPLGRIASLQELQTSLADNEQQLNVTRQRLREMTQELVAVDRPTRIQIQAYRAATQQADALKKSITNQRLELAELSTALRSAGVDTGNLAAEQKRLGAELAATQSKADAQQARLAGAREALNLRPHREIRQEISNLQTQYQLLRSSGTLTTAELAQAKVRLRERVGELTTSTNGWMNSLSQVHLQTGAAVAGMGALAFAGVNLLSFYAQYTQQMAAVDSITDLSRERFAGLSQEVRQLSVDMGKDAAQSAAALNDILSSGVSEENGISTLALSTKAAIAGLTDTATAARGGLSVVNAYGEGIDNLSLRYDQMFLAVRDGVTTFPELANYLGDVLPTAKAAGVGFDEVSAAIARMTIAGIRTPQATTALKGAINALAAPTPDAQKKMDELGITWRGLSATLEDIASRNLGLDAMRELIPDVEARTAVLSLTQDIGALRGEVEAMGNASGAMDAAYAKMSNTPQAELDRFNATWGEFKLQLGEAATAFLPVIEFGGDLLTTFNELPEPLQNAAAGMIALTAAGISLSGLILAIRNPFTLLLGHFAQTPGVAGAAAAGLETVAGSATTLIPKLTNLAQVLKLVKGGLVLGAVVWGAEVLADFIETTNQLLELREAQEQYEKALTDTIAATQQYADTAILPAAAVEAMTETERKAYMERLRLAEEHYRKQAELQSRKDFEKNGATGPVSEEALAFARQARELQQAQQAIKDAQAEREAAESRHHDAVAKIKADQLKGIQDALAKEIRLYEDANKKLEAANKKAQDAMKRRVDINKEFAQLVKDMKAAPDNGPATVSDVLDLQAGARQSVQRGDSTEALRQVRQAAEVLRELKESGANSYGFAGIAEELGRIADQAARIDEVQADVERVQALAGVDEIKARMDELLAKAEAFKRLNVEFTGFEQSAQQLEQQAIELAERLKKYMVIPVNYIGTEADAQAAANKDAKDLLEPKPQKRATGGWIDGPGSPTSDSVLVAASRDEFMLQARAARRLGATNLEFMNRTGELPPGRAALIPDIPALPRSLDRVGERQPLNLNMPWGGSYALEGAPTEVRRFQEDLDRAVLKFGARK